MTGIKKAYKQVFRDMLLHGLDMFRGIYDAKNGDESFMFGVQTVMEYIAYNVNEETFNKFSDMFTENMIKSDKE